MPHPRVLNHCGTTTKRLQEIFTATAPTMPSTEGMSAEEIKAAEEKHERCKKDYDTRCKFQARINSRLWEGLTWSLKNWQFYSAVDLAWEPPPIAPQVFPLLLYAQGKLDLGSCAKDLRDLKCADQFVQKNEKGEITGIDMPKFWEVSINLVRSIITRRLAAQANKYNNLFPYYKYESRSTSQVGKLRGDIMSQRADIMADQFDWSGHDTQCYRDMLIYGHSFDFIRCAWEKDIQWRERPKAEGDLSSDMVTEAICEREGLAWINPHPTRIFWDNAYALSSINSDTGCTYVGFWDVCRYSDINQNPTYWNRSSVGYNERYISLFQTYARYFSQYACTINPPNQTHLAGAFGTDLTSGNDLKNAVGLYSGEMGDSSVITANYFDKIIPKEWGIGDYPYPCWFRFVVAGWDTVLYAEPLASTPGANLSYNEKDDRRINLGMGHELLSYQDHMSNLQSYLLQSLKADNMKFLLLNTDVMTADQIKAFRQQAKGDSFYTQPQVLEVSFSALGDKGLGVDLKEPMRLVETKSGTQITMIFEAMLRLMQLVERLMALSPQEQGQPAPREISATETNLIAGTTESVYNFISDSIDRWRAAKKRIIYDSYMAYGEQRFRVPVLGRYTRDIIKKAGLELDVSEMEDLQQASELFTGTILGPKTALVHEFIFTSRDGSERASNAQAAQTLSEILKSILPLPMVQQLMTKGQFANLFNEVFRLSGAYDLKFEVDQGADEPMAPDPAEQFQQVMHEMTSTIEAQAKQIQQLQQEVQRIESLLLGAAGGNAAAGNGNGAPPPMPMPQPPEMPVRY